MPGEGLGSAHALPGSMNRVKAGNGVLKNQLYTLCGGKNEKDWIHG
jgi:hypothetical protein